MSGFVIIRFSAGVPDRCMYFTGSIEFVETEDGSAILVGSAGLFRADAFIFRMETEANRAALTLNAWSPSLLGHAWEVVGA